jgi:hypothetical protein
LKVFLQFLLNRTIYRNHFEFWTVLFSICYLGCLLSGSFSELVPILESMRPEDEE